MTQTISDRTANYATYICSSIAAPVLLARLYSQKYQPNPFDASFWIALFALVTILGRIVLDVYVLRYDTVSDILAKKHQGTLTANDL